MAELTRERREKLREWATSAACGGIVMVTSADLLSLLAAADERDRLREALDRLHNAANYVAFNWKDTRSCRGFKDACFAAGEALGIPDSLEDRYPESTDAPAP